MRYIYLDEAGTSAKEPVSVVVGIIVRTDEHWNTAQQELDRVLKAVPDRYRDGFVFHAKSIWGSKRLREGWSKDDRLRLIADVAMIPAKLGLSIALGKTNRVGPSQEIVDRFELRGQFSPAEFDHLMAFLMCVQHADGYLRERGEPHEIATLIAEDMPEMRTRLRRGFELAKSPMMARHEFDQGDEPFQGITKIKDGIQFATKTQAPLLQIADACAFSLRRFFAGQNHGEALVRSMGLALDPADWGGQASSALFTSDPLLRQSRLATGG